MLFNSLEFALFLPIVFLIYWAIGYAHINDDLKLRLQNAFVVIASYVFYGWWDWRFLLLIAFTSFCSWGSGLLIARGHENKLLGSKPWTAVNIVLNLAILALFKYYDFFVREFGQLFGISTDSLLLRIILPVGISFYTFQALSYSIDVYRKKIEPTRDIVAFFAYVSFFPQLVAGPIERATNLLPQFQTNRKFSYDQAVDGMRQILWGLFKKIVIADNCATYVDQVWASYDTQSGSTLLLAAIFFTFQIYGDFSGYSDIAIGTAKLFGIKLMRNFNNPYFSRDIAEFWRRWHISLTTWFRDYVYIPLGGSRPEVPDSIKHPERYKKWIIVRNTFVIFLLSGFWHGANWTFIAWGAYHAILFLPLILLGQNRKYTNQIAEGRLLPTWKECGQMFITFAVVVLGWIIFRAPGMPSLFGYMQGLFDMSLFAKPRSLGIRQFLANCIFIIIMLLVEWFQRNKQHGLDKIETHFLRTSRIIVYCTFISLVLYYGYLHNASKSITNTRRNEPEIFQNQDVVIPRYWRSYMEKKIAIINSKIYSIGANGDSFVYITDVHLDYNYGHSPALIKFILSRTPICNVIFGGDTYTSASSTVEAEKYLQNFRNAFNDVNDFIAVRGNHDTGNSLSNGHFYSIFNSPLENNINTFDKEIYFYKDNKNQKIRYIFCDNSDTRKAIPKAHAKMIAERITELDSGWGIVLFTHSYWGGSANGPTPTIAGNSIKSLLDSVADTANATIIALITGHVHADRQINSEKGYAIISTTCDANGILASKFDPITPKRKKGTTSEQAFDVFNIDTKNRKIFITRIGGNGKDRELSY